MAEGLHKDPPEGLAQGPPEGPVPGLEKGPFTFLDPGKRVRVSEEEIKQIQKRAVIDYYRRKIILWR